jgi:hypothetical protein
MPGAAVRVVHAYLNIAIRKKARKTGGAGSLATYGRRAG